MRHIDDRHHPDDPRVWKSGTDMGQGTFYTLPDKGRQFDRQHMRGLGWQLFQDFSHDHNEHLTRWWFKSTKAWQSRIEGIESMGYVAIDKLTNT